MPELPEVETVKTALGRSMVNAKIESVIIRNSRLRIEVPKDISSKIIGARINKFYRRAKYIVCELDNGISIIIHLGMSGKILICNELPSPLRKHDHIILKTNRGYLVYNDPRRFGLFTYCETSNIEEHKLFKHTGIEPFDNKLTSKYLFEKLQKKNIPIKAALLDQKIVVGIGNIYASEALFDAQISPLRPANKISEEECKKLIASVRKILQNAIKAGGSTLRDYEKPDGSLGYFQNNHCVYNKTGQKCPNCTCQNGHIQKTTIAGRSTFYCPHKQK